MTLFSERQGFKAAKAIQVDSMDQALRNGLWNQLDMYFWRREDNVTRSVSECGLGYLCVKVWLDHLKETLDSMPVLWTSYHGFIRKYFFKCEWLAIYDLIEFFASNYEDRDYNTKFIAGCNLVLERELSAYRFIGKKLVPVASTEEIAEIEEALESTKSLRPVAIHLQTALDQLSDRKTPDYRNSIKESISAIEAMCRFITGSEKATLGDALKVITGKIELHAALQQAFSKLYGYTSDAQGIRHSLVGEANIAFEDAKFMLVACSAFINYLKIKASKAEIRLETK